MFFLYFIHTFHSMRLKLPKHLTCKSTEEANLSLSCNHRQAGLFSYRKMKIIKSLALFVIKVELDETKR